jgi:Ser/Thr protein kinase RdoA (MazF antagonist)
MSGSDHSLDAALQVEAPSDAAVQAFGLCGPFTLMRDAPNRILQAHVPGTSHRAYLRTTPKQHRDFAQVSAEVVWMNRLADAGVAVVRPLLPSLVRTDNESLVFDDTSELSIATQEAPGRPAQKPADYRPEVIESWATLLGDLHRHAHLCPPGRRLWHEDPVVQMAHLARHPDTTFAQQAFAHLTTRMMQLPTHAESGPTFFGTTHADLHLNNLFVQDNGAVTAFDFDDACQHWFVHDVAVAIATLRKAAFEYPNAFDLADLETRFVQTYRATYPLPDAQFARLDLFIAYRLSLLACWASATFHAGRLETHLLAWYERSRPYLLRELERLAGKVHF